MTDHTIEDTLRELQDDPVLDRRRSNPWEKYGGYIILGVACFSFLMVGLAIGMQAGMSQVGVISEIHATALERQRKQMQESIDKLSADLAAIATISAQGQANAIQPTPPKTE